MVLTDIDMPRMDGLALLRALRRDPRTSSIPVILLSRQAGEESRVEGLEAGADDYLLKPFDTRELLARVTRRLEIASANRTALEREQALRKSAEEAERRYTTILESITDGIVVLDRDWRYTYVNAGIERTTGRRRYELLGRVIWELFPAEVGTEGERQCRRVVSENVPAAFENYSPQLGVWYAVSACPSERGASLRAPRILRSANASSRRWSPARSASGAYFELGLIGMPSHRPRKAVSR